MKKGAFQLSLSFIIIVVFSIIVLSLSIAWIQGVFKPLGDLTYKVTEVARAELLDRIASSDARVGIAAPAVTSWMRGETGSYAVGIRNTVTDRDKTFSMNVYLTELGGDLSGRSVSGYANDVKKWLTFDSQVFVTKSSSKANDIIIKPPTNADTGIYLFKIVVCDASTCTNLNSGNLYGSAQFALEIESQ